MKPIVDDVKVLYTPVMIPPPVMTQFLRQPCVEITDGVRYTLDQVLRRGRGRVHYDCEKDRFVMAINLDAIDQKAQIMFNQQRALRIWLVTKAPEGAN